MSDDNFDREFSLEMNLAGVAAASGGGQLKKGYYRVVIADMYVDPNKDHQVTFKLAFPGGFNRLTWLSKPKDAEDKVRAFWRAALESVGIDPVNLDKGKVKLQASTFLTKTAHVFYDPEARVYNGKTYDETRFLAPGTWEARKVEFDKDPNAGEAKAPNTEDIKVASNTTDVREALGL